MLNRRDFTLTMAATALPAPAFAQGTIPFYASAGPKLTRYSLDVAAAELAPPDSITPPAHIQYASPDSSKTVLYIVASNTQPGSGPMGVTGADKNHYAIAYKVGAGGALTEHGPRR